MTGETERSPSGWTPDTLKILEDEKIGALDRVIHAEVRRLDEALAALSTAVELRAEQAKIAQDKFEATVERDSVKQNEFRGSLDDLSKLMATRRETEQALQAVGARVDDLAKQVGDLRSRIDVGPSQIPAILSQQNQQLGRQQGIGVSVGALVATVTIVIALVAAIAAVIIATHH